VDGIVQNPEQSNGLVCGVAGGSDPEEDQGMPSFQGTDVGFSD